MNRPENRPEGAAGPDISKITDYLYISAFPEAEHASTIQALDDEHLEALSKIVNGMLQHRSFPLVTVHDEFKAHANNINHVRRHYREILAEIADSDVLDDLLGQIHKCPGSFNKLSFNLADLIRQSNYALC